MNELTLGGKTYVSSKRAAEITGYAKDYIGQLCREGHVEAKMVGRSWYVLESSIREHRFGKEEGKKSQIEKNESKNAPSAAPEEIHSEKLATWESPRYSSEDPQSVPPIMKAEKTIENIAISDTEKSISDMQTAWKEWFKQKKEPIQEPLLESPEVIDAREVEPASQDPEIASHSDEDSEEVAIPLNRLETLQEPSEDLVYEENEEEEAYEDEQEQNIPIQRISTHPVRAPKEYIPVPAAPLYPATTYRVGKQRVSLVAMATLIATAGIVIAIAVVGTGHLGKYTSQNPAIKFLEGTSTVEKQVN